MLVARPISAAISFLDSGQNLGGDATSTDVVLGDVDGDGDLDIVLAISGGRSQVWINQGRSQGGTVGTFSDSRQNLATGSSQSVALADLDGDGDIDAFFLDRLVGPGANQVWVNQGGIQGGVLGIFLHNGQTNGDDLGTAIALGELDSNPGPDAFVTGGSRQPDKVWFNNSTNQFTDSGQTLGADNSFDVALGDVDGDGDLDAFVVNEATPAANKVWINQGGRQGGSAGMFQDSGQNLGGSPFNSTGVALGDLDRDGDLDAFVAKLNIGEVWINQGGSQGGVNGTFVQNGQTLGPNDNAISWKVALGDLDRDGDLDAFIARFGPGRVFQNDGSGIFSDTGLRLGTASTRSMGVALGDLDLDGDLDAVVVDSREPLKIWLNQTPAPAPTFPEYIITTFAGNGAQGLSGDGGPATDAQLFDPQDVAVDAGGNVYIADGDGHRVRKVAAGGTISTFAGTGVKGFSGDGGLATLARLNYPVSVAVDSGGNVYIADKFNSCIRQINLNGIITTIAGHPAFPSLSNGDDGPASQASLFSVEDIVVDKIGNIYLTDQGSIRRVDTNGIIRTIAGPNSRPAFDGFSGDGGPATLAEFDHPRDLAVDSAGNLYIADEENHRIRKVDTNGIITTFAGRTLINEIGQMAGGYLGSGGLARTALLDRPAGVAVDVAGNLFISDSFNHRIRRVDTNDLISTVAGNGQDNFGGDGGPARDALLQGLSGLAVDKDGNLFFVAGLRVRKLSPTGKPLPLVPNYTSTPGAGGLLDFGTVLQGNPVKREIHVGNGGTADLKIESVEFLNNDAQLTLALSGSDSNDDAVSLPYTVPEGLTGRSLKVAVSLKADAPARVQTTLRIVSNDPDLPVANYTVRGAVAADIEGTLEESFLNLFLPPAEEGPSIVSIHSKKSTGPTTLEGRQTATLRLDTTTQHTVMSQVPSFLGGGSVVISNFIGSVTISLYPIPNDFVRRAVTVDGGTFTAPSFRLPSGFETGPNTLAFGPTNQSGGILVLTNGSYTAFASATIRNELFPQGFPVRGSYSGTFDSATGRATVNSHSIDLFEKIKQVDFLRSLSGFWLFWSLGNDLESATNILGPWRVLTNTASPFSVDQSRFPQEFFRVKELSP